MSTAVYPPGPKNRFPALGLLTYRRDPIALFTQLAREYGDISHVQLGPRHLVLLNHPDLIRDVLVRHHRTFHKGPALQNTKVLLGEGLLTSEGEFHLRQRRLAQPAFAHARVEGYGAAMVRHAAVTAASWEDGAPIDVAAEMSRLTLGIVAETMFGARVGEEADEILGALTDVLGLFDFLLLPWAQALLRLPLPSSRRFHRAKERLDRVVYRMIEARRAGGSDQGDLLSLLLLAQEADGERMTDRQLRDEALTIFLAGQETVANALTWTWYWLSREPEVERALHAELDAMLGDRLPTAADVPCLPYTRRVLTESMRLHPPAWGVGRLALETYEVGGYRLPTGTVIVLSQYVTHRDARWYPDPERFDPARWLPEAAAARPRHAYFPFGGGPRQCIGEGFAWMEGILLLATLAQHWRLHNVPGHPVGLKPLVTLRPAHGMAMTPEKR